MDVRKVRASDRGSWLTMREELWPGNDDDHVKETSAHFAGGKLYDPGVVLVAEEAGQLVGFAEVSIRTYAEGCVSQNVGYLEGWFVASESRRRGVGAALVAAAEAWAHDQGCTEFASDTEVDNELSRAAHLGLGFRDVGLVRCFSKSLLGKTD